MSSCKAGRGKTASVRIRQACRFAAKLHAPDCQDSDIVKARFVGMPLFELLSLRSVWSCLYGNCVALQAPSVMVTVGNALLVKLPGMAFLTGEAAANRAIVEGAIELRTDVRVGSQSVCLTIECDRVWVWVSGAGCERHPLRSALTVRWASGWWLPCACNSQRPPRHPPHVRY